MQKVIYLFLLHTLWGFSQETKVVIDSISQEKIIYYDTQGSVIGGHYEVFYANGILKEKGQTLNEFGCWMDSGKFEYYDENGVLNKTEFYNNWIINPEDGCHSTIQDITVNEYHENGKLKAEKSYQSSYEADEKNKVGVWRDFDTYGYVNNTKSYPWMYPHKELPNNIIKAEKALVTLFEKLKNSEPRIRYESVAPSFEKELLVTLNLHNSWQYPFQELSKKIRILSSKDSLIRTFAWDEREGGSRHNMKSYIQYKNNDIVHIENLRDNEEENGFRNATINEIVAFDNGYFIAGWGTFGSGAMHLIITYYKFVDGILKPWPIFENNTTEYGIEISRGDKFNLKIDPKLQQITFNETLYNEDMGYYYQTGKLTTLAFIDRLKTFVKKEEK
ncbi:hypothetical protein JBL43_06310 [Aureibaculum sp. A20]|uniref:MORN repeat variant n=1 Tax=Aureibaculum flavum TaxID=2795986 RepID=A0ABS0WPG2_9FLAO|nr:hypothetical protein [Aureibaculum flavum]MBJ2173844.1 hypothetical protein [Aureibaculum flavum]